MSLTEENLRKIGGGQPSREEEEEALYSELVGISQLLGKVNAALVEEGSTRPPTGSTRPPTGHSVVVTGAAACSRAADRPLSGSMPASCGGERVGASCEPPQVLSVTGSSQRSATRPELVNYTGTQSATAGISTRRKVDARAARSEMGSILFGA